MYVLYLANFNYVKYSLLYKSNHFDYFEVKIYFQLLNHILGKKCQNH